MAENSNLNVTHEADAQRQHARVKLPAELELEIGGTLQRFEVFDLSAGGLSIRNRDSRLDQDRLYTGRLIVPMDGFTMTVPVSLTLARVDDDDHGFRFEGLDRRQVAVLRHLITAFLAGDLIELEGMLHVLQRNNDTRPRSSGARQLSRAERLRALAGTLLFVIAGLGAVGFIGRTIWDLHFVTRATSARVTSDLVLVPMPRSGIFQLLLPTSEDAVRLGQPIASYQWLVDRFVAQDANADDDSVGGTIVSPCDCRIIRVFPRDGATVSQGQPIFELAHQEAPTWIEATFDFADLGNVRTGHRVALDVTGVPGRKRGRISEVRTLENQILVRIDPEDGALPSEYVNRPVDVTISWL